MIFFDNKHNEKNRKTHTYIYIQLYTIIFKILFLEQVIIYISIKVYNI